MLIEAKQCAEVGDRQVIAWLEEQLGLPASGALSVAAWAGLVELPPGGLVMHGADDGPGRALLVLLDRDERGQAAPVDG